MNLKATPEPAKHIKEALDFYSLNYDMLVYTQDVADRRSISIAPSGTRTCRYCTKSAPETTFSDNCHALVEAIGNRRLFSADECDQCNKTFGIGGGIDDHFGKWSLPYRVISCIRGKKGYPTLTRPHLGWRIDASDSGISVSMTSNHPIASFNEDGKSIRIEELPRDPFIPTAVYKAFVRMAIAIMPHAELPNFRHVIQWLLEPDHTVLLDNACYTILQTHIPFIAPPDTVSIVLARRNTSDLELPYMVFVLMFSNYVFQILVPSPRSLQNNTFKGTIFPLLFGIDGKCPITPTKIDLCGTSIVRNENVPFEVRFVYESMTHRHTTRDENIATKAYFIWQARGAKHGRDLDDWLLAESQVESESTKPWNR